MHVVDAVDRRQYGRAERTGGKQPVFAGVGRSLRRPDLDVAARFERVISLTESRFSSRGSSFRGSPASRRRKTVQFGLWVF